MIRGCRSVLPIIALGVLLSCDDSYPTLSSTLPAERFTATLSAAAGAAVSTGEASLTFTDPTTIQVELVVAKLTQATMAHIHSGSGNATGPILVTLLNRAAVPVELNGVLAIATLTPTTTLPTGVTFQQLAGQIRDGSAYVDVHTGTNPAGEIRGPIVPNGGN